MHKIAVLEDNPVKRLLLDANISSRIRNVQVTYLTTAKEGVKHLDEHYHDVVFLDYHLEGEETGVMAAEWIMQHQSMVGQVLIHSEDEDGCAEMLEILGSKAKRISLKELANQFWSYLSKGELK